MPSRQTSPMVQPVQTAPVRGLAGETAWLITDSKAGNRALAAGVAAALGCESEWKTVEPRGIYRLAAPWGGVAPEARFGQPDGLFAPPWPRIAIAAGRLSVPYLRALRRAAGLSTFTVQLLDPRRPTTFADLTWVPEHDRRRGAGIITTLTSPHAFSAARLANLRAEVPAAIAALPAPRFAVSIGGISKAYRWEGDDIARFAGLLRAIAALPDQPSLMITASRRTPPALLHACSKALPLIPHLLWDGQGENPYPAFLAHADRVIVTADSVNMAGEAAATGRPVHVFHPAGGGGKLATFHASLEGAGICRPFNAATDLLAHWTYPAQDAAAVIAAEIAARLQRRAAALGAPAASGATR